MDRWSKQDVSKSFKRAEGIEVSEDLRKNIEKAASLHLLAGNMTQYMVAMNSLAKLDTQATLTKALITLSDKVDAIDTGADNS